MNLVERRGDLSGGLALMQTRGSQDSWLADYQSSVGWSQDGVGTAKLGFQPAQMNPVTMDARWSPSSGRMVQSLQFQGRFRPIQSLPSAQSDRCGDWDWCSSVPPNFNISFKTISCLHGNATDAPPQDRQQGPIWLGPVSTCLICEGNAIQEQAIFVCGKCLQFDVLQQRVRLAKALLRLCKAGEWEKTWWLFDRIITGDLPTPYFQDLDTGGNSIISEAIRWQNLPLLQTCCRLSAVDFSKPFQAQCSLILAACSVGQIDIVEFIATHPSMATGLADAQLRDCLVAVISHPTSSDFQVGLLNIFIKHGLSTPQHYRDKDGLTLLMIASKLGHTDLIPMLMSAYPTLKDISTKQDRMTALMFAAEHGHAGVIRNLIAGGASVKFICTKRVSAFTLAAARGHEAAVRAFLDSGVDLEDASAHNPLSLAASKGHIGVVNLLLESVSPSFCHILNDNKLNDGYTPLAYATQNGHIEIMDILITAGAHPFQHLGANGNLLLVAVVGGHKKVVKKVLEYTDQDPNVGNYRGWTPVMQACKENRPDLLKLLLSKRKLNLDKAEDHNGWNAVMIAASQRANECLKMLLEGKAQVHKPSYKQCTALIVAADKGFNDTCEILLEYGANPDDEFPPLRYRPLSFAVEQGNHELIDILLKYRPNLDIKSGYPGDGLSLLELAVKYSRLETFKKLLSIGVPISSLRTSPEFPYLPLSSPLLNTQASPDIFQFLYALQTQISLDVSSPGDSVLFTFEKLSTSDFQFIEIKRLLSKDGHPFDIYLPIIQARCPLLVRLISDMPSNIASIIIYFIFTERLPLIEDHVTLIDLAIWCSDSLLDFKALESHCLVLLHQNPQLRSFPWLKGHYNFFLQNKNLELCLLCLQIMSDFPYLTHAWLPELTTLEMQHMHATASSKLRFCPSPLLINSLKSDMWRLMHSRQTTGDLVLIDPKTNQHERVHHGILALKSVVFWNVNRPLRSHNPEPPVPLTHEEEDQNFFDFQQPNTNSEVPPHHPDQPFEEDGEYQKFDINDVKMELEEDQSQSPLFVEDPPVEFFSKIKLKIPTREKVDPSRVSPKIKIRVNQERILAPIERNIPIEITQSKRPRSGAESPRKYRTLETSAAHAPPPPISSREIDYSRMQIEDVDDAPPAQTPIFQSSYEDATLVIALPPDHVLAALLEFIYTEQITNFKRPETFVLYEWAKRWQLTVLCERLEPTILALACPANIKNLCDFCTVHGLSRLKSQLISLNKCFEAQAQIPIPPWLVNGRNSDSPSIRIEESNSLNK